MASWLLNLFRVSGLGSGSAALCVFAAMPLLVSARAAELKHDLYVCGQMSKAIVMGGKATAMNGLYRSSDRAEIVHLGPNHPKIDAIIADPRDANILYLPSLNGLLRSPDRGVTWGILTSWDMTEPKGIAIDPRQPDHIYIALPDGIGVSRDRGRTWARMNEGIKRRYTQVVVVDRMETGRLIAGTELGIYLSDNDAKTWKLIRASDTTVNDIVQSPHDPKVFFAATQSNGAWWSADGARTWTTIPGIGTKQTLHNVAFDANDPRRLAICGWGAGVLTSEDGGKTWTPRNAGLPNAEVWRVAIDPDVPGRLYATPHEKPLHVSDDFGRTWRPLWFESTKTWAIAFLPRP